MLKEQELSDPKSCLNKAKRTERIFVLLGRDTAAPIAIRQWVLWRIRLHHNKPTDPQILEALECADLMEKELRDANVTPIR